MMQIATIALDKLLCINSFVALHSLYALRNRQRVEEYACGRCRHAKLIVGEVARDVIGKARAEAQYVMAVVYSIFPLLDGYFGTKLHMQVLILFVVSHELLQSITFAHKDR